MELERAAMADSAVRPDFSEKRQELGHSMKPRTSTETTPKATDGDTEVIERYQFRHLYQSVEKDLS